MPETNNYQTITIVGVGLIGGSFAMALRKRGFEGRILGISSPEALEEARRKELIDEGFAYEDLPKAAARSELIILATPSSRIIELIGDLGAIGDSLAPGTIISDVGSTKQVLVESLSGKLPSHVRFVGSHPMAGSEKTGVRYSQDDLFQGRVAIVTPSSETTKESVKSVCRFWEALGSRVITMTPDVHDQAVGAVSHLPHVAATVLAAGTSSQHQPLASSGWLDTTRVAAGDPRLWQQIFEENKDHVLTSIDQFAELLGQFRDALAKDDRRTVSRILKAGKRNRDALGS